MTTLALPQLQGEAVLTNSRVGTYRTCGRLHEFKYEMGLRVARTETPLRFGSAIHKGLEVFLQSGDVPAAIAAATVGYEEYPAYIDGEDAEHAWLVERETVAALLEAYASHWDMIGHLPEQMVAECLDVERVFDIPIINPATDRKSRSFRYSGKWDARVVLRDGRVAIMEHKTTTADVGPASAYWDTLGVDAQISGYLASARHAGIEADTVLYDVIRKPTIRPKQVDLLDNDGLKIVVDEDGERSFLANGKPRQSESGKGYTKLSRIETPEEYGLRLRADIAERPSHYFARREIPRLQRDLDRWAVDLWRTQQQITADRNDGVWTRNDKACRLYNRTCPYIDICLRDIDPTGEPPAGFVRVPNIHPELETEDDDA